MTHDIHVAGLCVDLSTPVMTEIDDDVCSYRVVGKCPAAAVIVLDRYFRSRCDETDA